jgi:hypothetical protein
MVTRLTKPRLQIQFETAETNLHRLIDGQLAALFIFGPPHAEMAKLVDKVLASRGVVPTLVTDLTVDEMRTHFATGPANCFWSITLVDGSGGAALSGQ